LLVSVVISNYNYARFLPAALDSVLSQTHQELEVIVVDDGSSDESREVLARYGNRIRLICQDNAGVSAARNAGILASRGEAVAFLDSDDVWDHVKIAEQVARLTIARLGLVYCGIEYIDEQGGSLGFDVEGVEGRILVPHGLLRARSVRAGSSAVVRRNCFDSCGLFDAHLSTSADWDMWRRIACVYDVAMVRRPLLKYRVHRAQMHHRLDVFERDMVRAVSAMFEDPAAAAIWPHRRLCYANLYATLCASYWRYGSWANSWSCALRSLTQRPDVLIAQAIGVPLRRVRRALTTERKPF
jgi:glycosyltransferase involved in cell wall biosynthesis